MKTYLSRRIPVAVAAGLALVMLAMGFLAALGVRSLVGTASADPAAPNPGHPWSQVEGHGIDANGYFLGTTTDQPLELRVNGARALRLQPDPSPSIVGGWSTNSVTPGVYGGTVAGGGDSWAANRVTDNYGAVGGGVGNVAGDDVGTTNDAWSATVAGGQQNTASGALSAVGGGEDNTASGWAASVGGGLSNTASDEKATVSGGTGNQAGSWGASIGGGDGNVVSAPLGTVGGGRNNSASGGFATVGGGDNNTASASHATIAGGGAGDPAMCNRVTDEWGTVGGGLDNQAGDNAGTTEDAGFATVAGGKNNTASAHVATVGGGEANTASDHRATVSGGSDNTASGFASTVSGGRYNTASANGATVAGGSNNTAQGGMSLAAGRRAKAIHDGAFVWADNNEFDFASTAGDEFSARATGGVRFVSAIDGTGNPTAGVTLAAGGGSWSSLSDLNVKANFTSVDGQDVLASLAEVPITTWNYRAQDDSIRHMGPVAQDFYGAFGLGESETAITTVDADGVALAAIQGLYQLSQEQTTRIQALEEDNAALRQRLDGLEARLQVLEAGTDASAAVSKASSLGLPALWPLLGGGLVLALVGLVAVQRRLAGGRR